MLEPILQQLGAGNPQLAQLISANPDQFLNLLSEAADDDVPPPPGAQTIAVTEEERDAIERLCRLGFDREAAIQAYFACDKNGMAGLLGKLRRRFSNTANISQRSWRQIFCSTRTRMMITSRKRETCRLSLAPLKQSSSSEFHKAEQCMNQENRCLAFDTGFYIIKP
jgi:hypothetical protein